MKDRLKKSISALSVIIFAFVVYQEVIAPAVRAQNGALQGTNLTFSDSVKMFETLGGEKGELPITVFVTSWCSVCKAIEASLQNADIKYARADIENNRDAYLYYQRAVRGQTSGVPVTVVGKDVFVGFDMANIAKSIKALRNVAKKA